MLDDWVCSDCSVNTGDIGDTYLSDEQIREKNKGLLFK